MERHDDVFARKRRHRRVSRRSKVATQPNVIRDLLENVDAIPEDPLNPEAVYRFALQQLTILGCLCPEYDIRMEALLFLAAECKPAPSDASAGRIREEAFVKIERILEARGLRGPDMGQIARL
jgi:hypothetical protein